MLIFILENLGNFHGIYKNSIVDSHVYTWNCCLYWYIRVFLGPSRTIRTRSSTSSILFITAFEELTGFVRCMLRLCINTRDELIVVDLERISFIKADGNYTHIMYISGQQFSISLGLSKLEQLIRQVYPMNQRSPFIRLGRSFIINQTYLFSIHVLKQKLMLSDCQKNIHTLNIPKTLLKEYKQLIVEQRSKKENE